MHYLDLFFEDEPTRELGNSPEEIYTVTKVDDVGYHAQVTISQYNSMVEENNNLPKESAAVLVKFMRTLIKTSGPEDCPIHVYSGNDVTDLETKKRYKIKEPNGELTDEEVQLILEKVDVQCPSS